MAKKLVVLAGPDEGKVFELGTETLLLGRSRATEPRLIDPHVSRVHCQIVPEGEHFALLDFDSAGGTFVNGTQILRHLLRPGDLIRIGGTHLQFIEDASQAAPAVAAEPKAADSPRAEAVDAWVQEMVGQTLGQYKVGAPLARGRTGYVFHGRDTKRNLPVALKILRAELTADEEKVQHFVEAMKSVLPLRHPNLLRCYAAGRSVKRCWVASEYVNADSLAAVIARRPEAGRADWRQVLRVGLALTRALEFAHGKGLSHQNLSPQNVLVGRKPGETKLVDLMLAAAVEEDPLKPTAADGTPSDSLPYLSPERTDGPGAKIDHRTDLYGVGATLYAMCIGRPPFPGATVEDVVEQIRFDSPPRLRTLELGVPDALEGLIRRALAKRPIDRPATAAEMRKELEGIARENDLPL